MAYRSHNVFIIILRFSQTRQGEICGLLQMRSPHCRYGAGQVGLIGGKKDSGETFEGAGIREAYEEAGIQLHPTQLNLLSHNHHGAMIYLVIQPSDQYYIPGATKHPGEIDQTWGYHGHKWCPLALENGKVVCKNMHGAKMWHRTSRTLQLLAPFLQGLKPVPVSMPTPVPMPVAMPMRAVAAPAQQAAVVRAVPSGYIVRTPVFAAQPQIPMGGMPSHMMTSFGAQPVTHLGHGGGGGRGGGGGGGRGGGHGRGGGTSRGPTTYNPLNTNGLY